MNKYSVLLPILLSLVSVQVRAVEITPPVVDEPIPTFPEIPIVPTPPVQAAVTATIGSAGGSLDSAAIHAVRRIAGSAVATGVVDILVVTSPRYNGPNPIEGGLSFCAEAGYFVYSQEFNGFVDELKSVQPTSGTFISIDLSNRCPVTLDNIAQVCTADVKTCPDGTDVGRIPPLCDFAACTGDDNIDHNDDQSIPPGDIPIPVEPDNGIGDGADPIPFL